MGKICGKEDCPLYKNSSMIFDPIKSGNNPKIMLVMDSPDLNDRTRIFQNENTNFLFNCLEKYGVSEISGPFLCATSVRCAGDMSKFSESQKTTAQKCCREYFVETVKKWKPKLILSFGAMSLTQTTKHKGIKNHQGNLEYIEEWGCHVMPCYGPGYILRNMAFERTWASAFNTVKNFIEEGWQPPKDDGKYEIEEVQSLKGLFSEEDCRNGIAVDTEAQGLDWTHPVYTVISYSICGGDGSKGYQVYLFEESLEDDSDYSILWERPRKTEKGFTSKKFPTLVHVKRSKNFYQKMEELRWFLENDKIKKVMHNGSFDCHAFKALFKVAGRLLNLPHDKRVINIKGYDFDTQNAAQLLDENLYAMSKLETLQKDMTDISELYDSGVFQKNFDKGDMLAVDKKALTDYAVKDTIVTQKVYLHLKKELESQSNKKLERYMERFVMPTVNTLMEMEHTGAFVDVPRLEQAQHDITKLRDEEHNLAMSFIPKAVIEKHRSKGLKLSRNDLVRDTLFSEEGYKLKPEKKTKSGEPSADQDSLKLMLDKIRNKKALEFIRHFTEYKKYDTLAGRYLAGFEKFRACDGRIHSKFSICQAATGRSACLTGDTPIYVLDSREKVAIKDIKAGDWVWSFDDMLLPIPAKVLWSGKTIENATIYEVTVQTQGSRQSKIIRCTGNHPFRLRDGSYVSAQDLAYGDRLLSIERSPAGGGYRRIHATGSIEEREHVIAWEALHSKRGRSKHERISYHVHHKDGNTINNSPDNLKVLSSQDHRKEHPVSDITKLKTSETLKKLYAEGKMIIAYRVGKDNANYKPVSLKWCLKVLHEAKGRPTVFRDVYGYDYECIMKKLKEAGINWKDIADRYDTNGVWISDKRIAEAAKQTKITYAMKILNVGYERTKKLIASDNNHMVISVKKLKTTEDVYDLTIPEHHNFIANGVCVHNSSGPNVQNIPNRGDAAPIVRRIIGARPGYKILKADASQAELRWMSHYAQDKAMQKVFIDNIVDIHTATAMSIVNINDPHAWDALSDAEKKFKRKVAKPVNFGYLYHMHPLSFIPYAKVEYGVDVSEEEALAYHKAYFDKYSRLQEYYQEVVAYGKEYGYVESQLGRRRRLPELNSHNKGLFNQAMRQAINFPIQSSSSDAVLMAANEIRKMGLPKGDFRLILFIHDELVAEVREDCDIDKYARIMKDSIENPPLKELFGINLTVPLESEVEFGDNLNDCKKWEFSK